MSQEKKKRTRIPDVGRDVVARGTFVAILSASEGDCDCNACKILRKIKDKMIEEFL